MPCTETFASLTTRIDASNYASAFLNGNRYIIQEQASLEEVYEHYPCPCKDTCTCRKHGCSLHWRMKLSVTFPEFCDAYLRMFVNRRHHAPIIGSVLGGAAAPGGRARFPVPFLKAAKINWASWGAMAKQTRITLLCDNWCDEFWARLWAQWDPSVYWAKVWAMLTPDLAVPYDSSSLVRIRACTGGTPPTYRDMLERLRSELIQLLLRQKAGVDDFRRLDEPGRSGLPFTPGNHVLISLRRNMFHYGIGYLPAERPLSRVIDKCFYTPASLVLKPPAPPPPPPLNPGDLANPGNPSTGAPANGNVRTIATLTHRGSNVELSDTPTGIKVTWGKWHGTLSNDEIEQLLKFFTGGNWKRLGASMDNPPPDGFGAYVHQLLPRFTPRHASAIATFFASEYGLECKRQGNAIWLRLEDED